jgi:DNA mismatch endonuclease, patch repair protein
MTIAPITTRSKIMQAVRSRDTGPELALRRLLSSMGYRYRLHSASLPGKPDISIAGKQKAIFVHGCFWHQHPRCRKSGVPKSNLAYWEPKLRRNVERDHLAQRALRKMGWEVLVVWQCSLRNEKKVRTKLRKFLGFPTARAKRRATNAPTA